MSKIDNTCWYTDDKCPICGALTATNGEQEWCSMVPTHDLNENDDPPQEYLDYLESEK